MRPHGNVRFATPHDETNSYAEGRYASSFGPHQISSHLVELGEQCCETPKPAPMISNAARSMILQKNKNRIEKFTNIPL